MVKRVRRALGGQSQVERICAGSSSTTEHSSAMTKAFWIEWSSSKKLKPIFDDCALSPDIDVESTCKNIIEEKKISDSLIVRNNLQLCLVEIQQLNRLVASIRVMQNEKFSSSNDAHETKLEKLWSLLLPGQEREGGRITREWGRIGFQQSDPATDFRGGGVLSLDQLIFIAEKRQEIAQRMIGEPSNESARYPWACVGINLTNEAIKILASHELDEKLYGRSDDECMEIFNNLYADMFEILHANWIKSKPENLLDFPPVLKTTMSEIRSELARTGTLVPPGV